jgi:putative colanic acid biosynthesis acetyltransferase WcaF
MNWELREYQNPKGYRGRSLAWVILWMVVDRFLFRPSPLIFYLYRNTLLRLFGAKIGTNCKIRPRARILFPWKLSLGDYSWIGDDVEVYNMDNVTIGSNTVISQRTYICTGTHSVSDGKFGLKTKPITIGNNVWICSDVFILPGSTVNDETIIPLRSIVR